MAFGPFKSLALALILGLSLVTSSDALAFPRQPNLKLVKKESIPPPIGWTASHTPHPSHIIPLKIALPQKNFHLLEQALYEVSDPSSGRYGRHLNKGEVEEMVRPGDESVGAVEGWLRGHGLDVDEGAERSPAGDWVTIRVPVGLAEVMLDTTFHVWTHTESNTSAIRCLSYSLPEHLHGHIDLIQPTTSFSRPRAQRAPFHLTPLPSPPPSSNTKSPAGGTAVDPSCNTTVTPTCLRQLYNIPSTLVPSTRNGNQIGVTAYLGEFANSADLQSFYTQEVPAAVNSSFKVISVNGGTNPQNASEAGVEANLDTQYAFGLTFPTPATFWSTAGSPPFDSDEHTPSNTNEPYLDWLAFVLSQEKIPQTISTSYDDDEQSVPESFAQRVCAEFAQLGARGVSLLFASGDFGVGDGDPNADSQQCITNGNDGGIAGETKNITRFVPNFPSTCPFVTSVGATHFIDEVATDFSGGGFSNFFPRPAYQDAAVTRFLDRELPPGKFKGLFNPNGRGIPDISAQGDNFVVFIGGGAFLVGGTSASTPAVAAIVSLLNDARLSRGLPSLGFLNPLLYSEGVKGLNDVVGGNAPGCGTEGFNATVGWDPITGLGTPNFGKLKDIVLL